MATRNKLELLSLGSNVKEWFERFEFYVVANGLKVEATEGADEETSAAAVKKNLAIFVSRCDADIYKLLKSLCSQETVVKKP